MASTSTSTTTITPLDPARLQAKFDLGIALILSSWDALSLAVSNEWGGPDSSDKRDWFAGAVSELFTSEPATDEQDVEEMLLQVMEDEFEVALDDGSEMGVAAAILRIRGELVRGEEGTVDRMWETFQRKKGGVKARAVRQGPDSDSGESVDDETDEEGEDEDVQMGESEQRPARTRQEPEVDEDGFTKVVGRRR